MQVFEHVPLREHSSMRLGGEARYSVKVSNRQELRGAVEWAEAQGVQFRVIGHGTNIIWKDEGFAGLLIINNFKRFEIFHEDGADYYVTVGAGEVWDSVVARCTEAGLSGIEALSLVPGTAGATPVQNVGAYGQEIADALATLEVFDTADKQFKTMYGADCGFGYRTSRFKTTDEGKYVITAITLHLRRQLPKPPFYDALQRYINEHGITDLTPVTIREAVIAIRTSKLPDPAVVANVGSFFGNPIIDEYKLVTIQADHPEVSYWPVDNGQVKLSAAWLIQEAGFKAFHDPETGMATWDKQSLVFVNEHAETTADLLAFKQKIVDGVRAKFGVTLHQEPELLP